MFTKLLIANRGEIACRIIATAKRMGIETVAVFSDADRQARHVRHADYAVHIGPAASTQSYLRGDHILNAALSTGAQAIHPGYGFLSENATFAQACVDAGIAFVGPRPNAILEMGLKDRAKEIARSVGAPILPGYWGEDQSMQRLLDEAASIGFPLLIKAVAGGGGRGIRAVSKLDELPDALAAAKREAAASFGDDRMMLELLVQKPRHLEVQVFGDSHANLVHLFERDCSIQRRRQKLIEEAPAPGMTSQVRDALTGAAIKIAKAVDYSNAGTVEFVADGTGPLRPDGFWFLEMNTRLQVEHPVTEAITGLDLVEWQLRVAAGEALPLSQEQITMTGAAIEARIVAEDPAKGFLPSSGYISGLANSKHARVDTGFDIGDTFPDSYDSLVKKVIVHGDDRSAAIAGLVDYLEADVTLGIATNTGFIARILRRPQFASGWVHTGFLEEEGDAIAKTSPIHARLVGVAAIGVQYWREQQAIQTQSPFTAVDGWRLNGAPVLNVRFKLDDEAVYVGLNSDRVQLSARANGDHAVVARGDLSLSSPSCGDIVTIAAQDGGNAVCVIVSGIGATLVERGEVWVYPFDAHLNHEDETEALDDVKANLPGKIVALNVAQGAKVKKGDTLLVLEAMKMEHSLCATRDGIVQDILTTLGKQVRVGELLVRLEAV